ncbi:MAG: DnaJ domain-containing protein [Candidatus Aminicenantes bacterium]|nr:DnaJ domain-containing protein [Candidatus Aminicenantes bacterium]
MKIKNSDKKDHYQILNVNQSASQQDIDKAYEIAVFSFQKNSLAHYTLIDEDQRKKALKKVEEAYQVLSDPQKRREYDQNVLRKKSEVYHNSYFRNSTERLFIEDGDKGLAKLMRSLKEAFHSNKSQKKNDP